MTFDISFPLTSEMMASPLDIYGSKRVQFNVRTPAEILPYEFINK